MKFIFNPIIIGLYLENKIKQDNDIIDKMMEIKKGKRKERKKEGTKNKGSK